MCVTRRVRGSAVKKTFVVTLVSYVKRRSYNQPLTETHHSEAGQQSRSSAGGFQLGSAQVELSPGQRLQRVLVQTHSVKVVPLHFFLAFVCLKSSTKLQLQFRLHRVRRAKVRWRCTEKTTFSKVLIRRRLEPQRQTVSKYVGNSSSWLSVYQETQDANSPVQHSHRGATLCLWPEFQLTIRGKKNKQKKPQHVYLQILLSKHINIFYINIYVSLYIVCVIYTP